jgi:hypothetical protein
LNSKKKLFKKKTTKRRMMELFNELFSLSHNGDNDDDKNVVAITTIASSSSSSFDSSQINVDIKEKLLTSLLSRYKKDANVRLKTTIPSSFLHGVPSYLTQGGSYLHLKREDRTEFCFYDPLLEKWVVVTAVQINSCFGSNVRDLPIFEWPHMIRKSEGLVTLEKACNKSFMVHQQMEINGFKNVDTVPVYLLLLWLYNTVPLELTEKIHHAILIDISHEHINVEKFITEDLRNVISRSTPEYAHIFPEELVNFIINNNNNNNASTSTFQRSIIDDSSWIHYIISFRQLNQWNIQHCNAEQFLVPPPPKIHAKKLQHQLKQYYESSNPQESPIGASVEYFQNPDTVLKVDESGYRVGTLTSPAIISLVEDLNKKLDFERSLRISQENDFKTRVRETETTLREEYLQADRSIQRTLETKANFDRRFRDIATRSRFEMHLEGTNIPTLREKQLLINAIRKYRLVMDNIYSMFLSLLAPYTDSYLLNAIPEGDIKDPIPHEKPPDRRFTFHDLIGRRFLMWSSSTIFDSVNNQLNQLKAEEDFAVEGIFRSLEQYFPNGFDEQLESITSQWPSDILYKLVDRVGNPAIAGKGKKLGSAMKRIRSLIVSRFGVADFGFFRQWISMILLRKHKRHTLPLYGIYINGDAFDSRLSRVESIMNALLGNDTSVYASSYEYLSDRDQFKENVKNLLINTLGSVNFMDPVVNNPYNDRSLGVNVDSIDDYKSLQSWIQPLVRDRAYQSTVEQMFSTRIKLLFLENGDYKRDILSQIIDAIFKENEQGSRKWLAVMNAIPIFQNAFRALKVLIDFVDTSGWKKVKSAFSQIDVNRLPTRKDGSLYVVPSILDNPLKGLEVSESESYARDAFTYGVVTYYARERLQSLATFFNIPVLNGKFDDVFSSVPNYYSEMQIALASLQGDFTFLSLRDAGEFDPILTKNITANTSPIDRASVPNRIKDAWNLTNIQVPRTHESLEVINSPFYEINGSNRSRYSLLIMRTLCLFDIHLHGNFLERDYGIETEFNTYFALHLNLFNILTEASSSLNGDATWRETFGRLTTEVDLRELLDLLYEDLLNNAQKQRLVFILGELFTKYVSFLGGEETSIWPYSQVDPEAAVDTWIQHREAVTGLNVSGNVADEKRNVNALWNHLIDKTPSLRGDIALFFMPFLSLIFVFNNPWYLIKYSLWLLDPDVVARMYNTGRLLRKLPQGVTKPERLDHFIIQKGFDDTFLVDETLISSPILNAIYDFIDSDKALYKERTVLITQPSIMKLIDFVNEYKASDVDQDTKTRVLQRLYELGYDTFPLFIFDEISRGVITAITTSLSSGGDPSVPFLAQLQDAVSGAFNVSTDFSDADSGFLLEFDKDFQPILSLLNSFEQQILREFSLNRYDKTIFRVVSQLVAILIYIPYVPLDALARLRSEFTTQDNDHQPYLEEQEVVSSSGVLKNFYIFILDFYVTIVKSTSVGNFPINNIKFSTLMRGFFENVTVINDLNKRRALGLYATIAMVFTNGNEDRTQVDEVLKTMGLLYDSTSTCSLLNNLIEDMERSTLSVYDYRRDFIVPVSQLPTIDDATSLVIGAFDNYLENVINPRDASLRDRVREIEELRHIHQFYSFYCQSISLSNLKEILKLWNVEFSLPPIDSTTLQYALLRDYHHRELVDEIFDSSTTITDVLSSIRDDIVEPRISRALEDSQYILAAATKRVGEVISNTYSDKIDDLPSWKKRVNTAVSPIHYFFENLGIAALSPSSSSLGEVTNLDTLFNRSMRFIPDIINKDNFFDIGEKMLLSRIIQIISEAFASRLGYVSNISNPSEMIPRLLDIKDYLLSDPRDGHPGVLGMKQREQDSKSFTFPFISPFLNTQSLRHGSHVHLAQMIIHLTSPYQ